MKKNIKYIISTMVAMVSAFIINAAPYSPGDGYDPDSPGDPNERYRVTTMTAPSRAGWTSPGTSGELYSPNDNVTVWAYTYENWVFTGWYDGENLVSEDQYYTFIMPSHRVHLVAHYDYQPGSPGDPMADGYYHRVRVFIEPERGGWSGSSRYFLVREGDSFSIRAYANENYKFNGWKVNGENIAPNLDGSFNNPIWLTMGSENMDVVMKFAYAPNSPGDPFPNSYNPDTFELIVDNFQPGNLWGTVCELLSDRHFNVSFEDVHSAIIAGRMEWYDCETFRDMTQLSMLDLARTSGLWYLEPYYFENLYALTNVVLPESLTEIPYDTFRSSEFLNSMTCYALIPPYVNNDNFKGVDDGLVVRVPASSLTLYQQAQCWKNYTLIPIESGDCSIIVNLPEEAADGRYKGMYIVLENPGSGQTQRIAVNDRMSYTFDNLIMNTAGLNLSYNVYLRNKDGENLASHGDIKLTEENPVYNVDFKLDEIKKFYDLSLRVLQDDGKDVANEMTIVWKTSSGEHAGSTAKLKDIIEGKVLTATVTLPDSYGKIYKVPASVSVVSGEGDNTGEIQLVPYAKEIAEGIVTNDFDGKGIERAFVTVEQTLAGKYRTSGTGVTDKDGKYRLEYIADINAPGKVTARADGFVTQPCEIKNFTDWDQMKNFEMKPISGAVINVSLIWKAAGSTENKAYADYNNVDFSLYNKTKDEQIYNISNQYPLIVILDDVDHGDDIIVTASSRNGVFEPAFDVTGIDDDDKGEVKIQLVEHGKISASINGSESETVSAVLYDETGHRVKHAIFDSKNGASFSNLTAGDYTLVAISDSPYFNGVTNLADFKDKYDFTEGTDYLAEKVTVKDGEALKVTFGNVPMFDESSFYYTDPALTLLKTNKSSVTAGNYVTISSHFNFLKEYRGWMENVKMTFELPEHCAYVQNSLINNDEPGNLTYEGNNVYSLENVTPGTTVKFCVMPEKGGNYYPTASIEFDYMGQHYSQPLGSVFFQGVDFKLYVPQKTCRDYVWARGVAANGSDVTVFVHGAPAGAARAGGNGEWVTRVDLYEPNTYPIQQVYGEISTATKGTFPTESHLVEYDEYYPELQYARMVHNGFAVDFDHSRAKTSAKSYSYNPSMSMFTLTAKFEENKERVKSVTFHILCSDGWERDIDAVYSMNNDQWVAALSFSDSYRLPVNVTVEFTYIKPVPDPADPNKTVDTDSDFNMDFIAPDVQPIIDPSGFVYETVEDNRIENATVTIFHRDLVENIYGEEEWVVSQWDAEEYGQENPLYTDKEGLYGWDVPSGDWRVKFEKEGYETAFSEWLPVPPPQLEVNMGLVRNDSPKVTEIHAYAESNGVEIMFDRYMDYSSLGENIYILKKNAVAGQSDERVNGKLTHVRTSSEDATENDEETPQYTASVRFVPDEALSSTTTELELIVSSKVKSYSGIEMGETRKEKISIEKEITGLAAESATLELAAGEMLEFTVSATPADAAYGKKLRIANKSPYVLGFYSVNPDDLDEEGALIVKLNEKGQAKISIEGYFKGQSQLDMTIEGSNVEGNALVNVKDEIQGIGVPVASLPDRAVVFKGEVSELTSRHPGATIYYTVDGSEPTIENGIKYTGSIVVDRDMTIKAIAVSGDLVSDVAEFNYTLKRGKMDLTLHEGWSWISHNMENPAEIADVCDDAVARILSQTAEVTNDSKYGFVGTLKQLSPEAAYKVQSTAAGKISLEDLAYNPSENWISLESGWNWIGYPHDQILALDEAFDNAGCEEGDYIETLDGGFAIFTDGIWLGNLVNKGMVPGTGYLYRSTSDKDIMYNTRIVSNASSRLAAPRKNSAAWAVDNHKYPSIMPVIADVIRPDGSIAEEGEYQVGAFCGSECRGIGEYVSGYIFMSVYGNPGDKISFRLLPKDAEDELLLNAIVEFTEEPVGTLASPFKLNSSESGVMTIKNESGVKINVQNRNLYISGKDVTYVAVYDLDGNKFASTRNVESPVSLDGVNVGVYIVAVENSGIWSYHKIMVK